ncbi:putative clathrin assembly protein At1g03050 [Cynara cardunculus var. scolymus]|uniref:AP180 N-terminal homology (ANTH) domain-containing protein n=1 Tax=Cynara cardunculus var. scolymus TaxID=59895 RepID=A0A124SCD4_CYNCS|nr:putative clathrin assembly protein At1g03050 [Cynara cardunculus var. scolymus]KVH93446.1 AP180 N-terminal homology (ANTH) domain-containing protein [Cynara cardunculus var. scolymus]
MGLSSFREAIGEVKDQTSISLAKVASFSDLRVAIVKATRHKACPAKEHHIQEILSLASYSRQHAASCIEIIAQRLKKTKDWVVALKALILIQRLIQVDNPVIEQGIFFASKNGTHILDLSNFRDTSWANSWDYTAFIRSYAVYLREQLDHRMQERKARHDMLSYEEDEEEHPITPRAIIVRPTPIREMQNKQIYTRSQRVMKLLDSFLVCRPAGAAKNSRLVDVALYPIVKQSFRLYYEMEEIVTVLMDRFTELDVADCKKLFEMFCRVAKQFDELDAFYCWCNDARIARTSDYPEVAILSQNKLDVMEEFIQEKIEMEQQKKIDYEPKESEPEPEMEPEPKPDVNATKALPPLIEGFEEEEEEKEEKKTQDIGHLLNLEYDDVPTVEEHGDKLALALFGDGRKTGAPAWEAFNDESGDWEKALVETASQLSTQQPSLPGGFNTLILDGMYQQGATQAAMRTTGSASSVAFGSAGTPAMLALPAPLSSANGSFTGGDPFATSLTVAPPSYVQMFDMEKKQRLLMEEQMMWQQYYNQGQVGLGNTYHNTYPYNQPCYNMVGY